MPVRTIENETPNVNDTIDSIPSEGEEKNQPTEEEARPGIFVLGRTALILKELSRLMGPNINLYLLIQDMFQYTGRAAFATAFFKGLLREAFITEDPAISQIRERSINAAMPIDTIVGDPVAIPTLLTPEAILKNFKSLSEGSRHFLSISTIPAALETLVIADIPDMEGLTDAANLTNARIRQLARSNFIMHIYITPQVEPIIEDLRGLAQDSQNLTVKVDNEARYVTLTCPVASWLNSETYVDSVLILKDESELFVDSLYTGNAKVPPKKDMHPKVPAGYIDIHVPIIKEDSSPNALRTTTDSTEIDNIQIQIGHLHPIPQNPTIVTRIFERFEGIRKVYGVVLGWAINRSIAADAKALRDGVVDMYTHDLGNCLGAFEKLPALRMPLDQMPDIQEDRMIHAMQSDEEAKALIQETPGVARLLISLWNAIKGMNIHRLESTVKRIRQIFTDWTILYESGTTPVATKLDEIITNARDYLAAKYRDSIQNGQLRLNYFVDVPPDFYSEAEVYEIRSITHAMILNAVNNAVEATKTWPRDGLDIDIVVTTDPKRLKRPRLHTETQPVEEKYNGVFIGVHDGGNGIRHDKLATLNTHIQLGRRSKIIALASDKSDHGKAKKPDHGLFLVRISTISAALLQAAISDPTKRPPFPIRAYNGNQATDQPGFHLDAFVSMPPISSEP